MDREGQRRGRGARDGRRRRRGNRRRWRFTPLLVAVVGLGLLGAIGVQALLQRGAGTPEEAADRLVAALESGDWLDLVRLLPPDEVDWARGVLVDVLRDLDLGGDERDEDLDVEVMLGERERVADDLEVVEILSVTADVPRRSPLGRAGLATHASWTWDAGADGAPGLVLVERDGRWFVSPLGTVLEALADGDAAEAVDGPPRPRAQEQAAARTGAEGPQQVVDLAARALAGGRVDAVLGLLDPAELQVLDHYAHQLGSGLPLGLGMPVDLTTRAEGAEVVLEEVDVLGERLDLRDWCRHGRAGTHCVADTLEDGPRATVLRPLLADAAPEVRLGTVERDGRHHLSLEGTLEATVAPLLADLDGHAVAALLDAPHLSPHVPSEPVAPGATTTLRLHDGWGAVPVAGAEAGAVLVPCVGSPGRPLEGQRVDGREVRVRRLPAPTGADADAVYAFTLEAPAAGTSRSLQVRFVDDLDAC